MQNLRVNNSIIITIKNETLSRYYFYMNSNTQGDFQICISVPLNGTCTTFSSFFIPFSLSESCGDSKSCTKVNEHICLQSDQNIWSKVKKSSKIGQEKKNFDSCFCVVSEFPKILSYKSFGNSHTKFLY